MCEYTVATYNVRHAGLDDGEHAWPRRRPGVLETIDAVDPDVLALQESSENQQTDIVDGLPSLSFHGDGRPTDTGANNPVGVGSRFAVTDTTVEWLSETPGVTGSVGWDGAHPRTVTRVGLRDTDDDRELTVFGTHFDHRGQHAREESARLLRKRIDGLPADRAAVVLGDLNCRPASTPYLVLTGDGFERSVVDARAQATTVEGPDSTVTDFRTVDAGRHLDHVFVTDGLDVGRYRVHDWRVDGQYPSDHLPVGATLRP